MGVLDWTFTTPHVWSDDGVTIGGILNSENGFCLELETFRGKISSNPDTEFWHPYTQFWPVSENDGHGKQSKIRLWLDGSPSGLNSLAGYWQLTIYKGELDNSEDFALGMTRLNITRSACTTAQSHTPWLRIGIVNGLGNQVLANGNLTSGAPSVP